MVCQRIPVRRLSQTNAQTIPLLVLKDMLPHRWSRTSDTLHRLDTLIRLLITDVSGQKDTFTLSSFFLSRTSRLPITEQSVPASLREKSTMIKQKPDVCIQRSFAEFETLRREISIMISENHPHYCVLCGRLRFLLFVSLSQPTVPMKTLLAFSAGQRAKRLQAFVEDVVGILRNDRPRCVYACTAHKQLPVVLHDFIFQEGAFGYESTAVA